MRQEGKGLRRVSLRLQIEDDECDVASITDALLTCRGVRAVAVVPEPPPEPISRRDPEDATSPPLARPETAGPALAGGRYRTYVPISAVETEILAILNARPFETTQGFYIALSFTNRDKISKALQRLVDRREIQRFRHGHYCCAGKSEQAESAWVSLEPKKDGNLSRPELDVLRLIENGCDEHRVAIQLGFSRQRANTLLRQLVQKKRAKKIGRVFFKA